MNNPFKNEKQFNDWKEGQKWLWEFLTELELLNNTDIDKLGRMLLHPRVDTEAVRNMAIIKDAQNQAYAVLVDLTYDGFCNDLEKLEGAK
jgi:hypothetical protein